MGYFLTAEPRRRMAAGVLARPKTHTPGSRVSNLGYRFYSPGLGRWINRDPVSERGGMNLYLYCANSPPSSLDPWGLTSSQYHNFPGIGIMWAHIKDGPPMGPDRRIKIEFILAPGLHCKCDTIDFLQTMTFENLEGTETKWREGASGTDFDSNAGVAYPDPESGDYYIAYSIAAGFPRGVYVDTFYSWMTDAPGRITFVDGVDTWHEWYVYFEGTGGSATKRKVRTVFQTCATCIEGAHAVTKYGCVKWKLDYPNLDPKTKPVISVLGFASP